jgi:hypothetical protein
MLSVSVPALVVEDLRATEAMGRSWNLVKSHFWHVLGVIVVAAILTGIVAGIIRLIGGSSAVGAAITGAIGQIIVAPYSALVSVPALPRPARSPRGVDGGAVANGAPHGGLKAGLPPTGGRAVRAGPLRRRRR